MLMHRKKLIFLLSLCLFILLSLTIYQFKNSKNNEHININGGDIYNTFNLKQCDNITVFSLNYIDDGELKGAEKSYSITDSDALFTVIISSINNLNSSQIIIKDYRSYYLNTQTHSFGFDIQGKFLNVADYSLLTNQLVFIEIDLVSQLTNHYPSVIIVNMDESFKEIIKKLKPKIN